MEFHDDMNPVELLLAYILEHRLDNSLISLSNGYFVLQKILESFNEEEDDSSDGIIFECRNTTQIFWSIITILLEKDQESSSFPQENSTIILCVCMNFFRTNQ
jgi:hypothetical protein